MNTRFRARMFELGIKKASEYPSVYFQRDQKTGRYRGIIEGVNEDGTKYFKPEKPVVGRTKDEVMRALKRLGIEIKNDRGEGSMWVAESNMPFDKNGNRVE